MKPAFLAALTFHCWIGVSSAATTIHPVNSHAYGANLGWIDWRGDTTNGAVIGEYVCAGYLYAANAGWIHLGGGSPTNGIRYQNLSASDFGVNHDGLGNLRGFAYGANIGWIWFVDIGGASVDLKTGRLSGHIYSANCGWISLSNAFAQVQTDSIRPGADTDGDGIADAWERIHTNTLAAFTALSDSDGDGVPDRDEYLADTNPTDPGDFLRITSILRDVPKPARVRLEWNARPTRCYAIQARLELTPKSSWSDRLLLPSPGAGSGEFEELASEHFYRIRAFRPLWP